MKVKHVLMIAAVLLAMFVAPVAAADTTDIGAASEAVYSFQIPDDFDFTSAEAGATKTDKVSVDIESIDPEHVVEVSVTSENAEGNDLYLKHVSGTGYRLLYTMTVGSTPVVNGGIVISTDYDAEEDVIFTLEETATKSGRYEDTLTFTAEMVQITSNDYAEQAVYTFNALQDAINAATGETTITLGADITGDVLIPQKAGVKITIDGNGKKYNGVITVDGNSIDTAALTLRNINFEASYLSKNGFIILSERNTDYRYTNHVTVKDCTFTYTGTDTGIAAVRSNLGGDKYLILDGCKITDAGMHSLLQVANVNTGLKVIDCTVATATEGINLQNTQELEMSGCSITADLYAVRFGATGGGDSTKETFSISDSTLTSTDASGSAIIFRATALDATLTLTDTTLSGTTAISGNTADTTIIQVVDTEAELLAAIDAGHDVILTSDIAVTSDTTITVGPDKDITLDLNGHTLSSTSSGSSGNKELFLVKGTMTVLEGTITYKHTGDNMAWNAMSTIFDVTAGGVLNMDSVTAKNLGGTDMNFVVHLNNWGEVTLNAEDCTLEAPYVTVRAFNSGYDMNNVVIKNSELTGNYVFWVHNFTPADFGASYDENAINARLNVQIYNNGNTFHTNSEKTVRYGRTNAIYYDSNGDVIA